MKRYTHQVGTLLCGALLLLAGRASADVKMPAIFSDHMVLQSDTSIPVWGWADPGEKVTVSIGGESKSATADKAGKWSVKLGKLKAGSTLAMRVKGKNSITINDVLVGEVWLCSGQSNMAMTVNRSKDFDKEQASANYPRIRMFTVARNPQPKPQDDCKGTWELCSASTVGNFSAAGYFFGRELHNKLRVPVGLINSSYGGTAVEAWTSMAVQEKLPEYKTISEPWVKATSVPWNQAKADANYEKQLAAWKEKVKQAKASGKTAPRGPQKPVDPRLNQNYPANLYNGMIAPIIPYAIQGAIWYQGESNAGKPFADLYGMQLKLMISDWRKRWGNDFSFGWVQLPDFKAPQTEPVESTGWSLVREGMLDCMRIPKTGMAITLGLGEANDIHPKNKQDVGRRLAMWALADVYRQKGVAACGPLPIQRTIKGGKIVVKFRHTDGGLKADGGKLKGFAIAGHDQQWVAADARIEGDTVVVSSPSVAEPVAVRYAWADNPIFSLCNGAGLPATPFRTDNWK